MGQNGFLENAKLVLINISAGFFGEGFIMASRFFDFHGCKVSQTLEADDGLVVMDFYL
jgi:hypothetical protein